MGQKTNPNILRLGVIKNWDSKYIEKKSSEIAFFDFKSLEIKKFLEKLFKDNKMILHCCKLSYSENNLLQIFISYYAMPEYFIKKNPLKPVKNKKLFYYKTLNSKTFKYLSNFIWAP